MHIPDWYLSRRVVRHEDLTQGSHLPKNRTLLSVAVTHGDSGEHATCSIPAGGDIDPAKVLSRLIRALWSRRLDDNEKRRVEKYLEERIEIVGNSDVAESMGGGDDAEAKTDAASTSEGGQKAVMVEDAAYNEALTKLNKLSNDIDLDPRKKMEAMRRQSAKMERVVRRREVAKNRQMSTSKRLSALTLAEVRATISASLTTLRPAAGDSFPAAKTNIILHSPAAEHEKAIDHCVYSTAKELGSDVIVLTAQDLALIAGDYLGEGPEPSPRSIRSLGYDTYRLSAELNEGFEDFEAVAEDEADSNQPPSLDSQESAPGRFIPFRLPILAVSPALTALTQGLKNMQMAPAGSFDASTATVTDETSRTPTASELQLEDLKIAALLDVLIDTNDAKRARGITGDGTSQSSQSSGQSKKSSRSPAFFDYSLNTEGVELELNSTLPTNATPSISLSVKVGSASRAPNVPSKSKIIFVKDFKELNATHYGGRIIQKLEELVRKRRNSGESIMIVGSTCSRDLTPELSAR